MSNTDFDNLQGERRYSPMMQAYTQSKLAELILALELQPKLTAAHSLILNTAAHAGYANTNLQTSGAGDDNLYMKIMMVLSSLSQDAHHGALPTLFAALSPTAEPGGYCGHDGLFQLNGAPTTAKIPAAAKDQSVAKWLCEQAERLTGVTFASLGRLSQAPSQRGGGVILAKHTDERS